MITTRTTSVARRSSARQVATHHAQQGISLCCWHCNSPLVSLYTTHQEDTRRCEECHAGTTLQEGIWRSLSPQDTLRYSRFITEYETIREHEGRGNDSPDYYHALPYKDLSGRNAEQWKIRARTFAVLQRQIIAPFSLRSSQPLRILDLGAGNGWLSCRLAQLGHLPTAVDLLVNDRDGLGAARHYATSLEGMFPRVQANLDRLPFQASSYDIAIFNASFHYSEEYTRTLAEALRRIRPGGQIVIADSPWYAREESGRRMVEEKHTHFKTKHGTPSNSIPSLEFLTPTRLETLASACCLEWRTIRPFYGVQWALRPWKAILRGARTPSQFYIHMAEVGA